MVHQINTTMDLETEVWIKNGKRLQISRTVPEDAAAVIEFVNQIAGESDNLTFGKGEFLKTIEQEKQYFSDLQKSKNSVFIVGKVENQVVSVADLSAPEKKRLQHAGDIGISVLKEFWHLGIGTAMMHYLIAWATHTKIIRKIDLSVRISNPHAIALYKNLGFKEEGIKTRCMFIQDEFCDTLEMGLEID